VWRLDNYMILWSNNPASFTFESADFALGEDATLIESNPCIFYSHGTSVILKMIAVESKSNQTNVC
jgi:hypothetical protein